ncbi:MAG: response regulator [Elusimicrobia bacterium]|nr:response regulator [Elusimicrobiota bacterium]
MGEKKRILVVDDEPNLLSMLVDFCDDIDVVAIPAENGSQALAKALSEKPDAITVDHRMPDMTGLDVISKIKTDEATKHIPIVLVTADGKLNEAEAMRRGAFGVLPKPVSRASLKQMLESCLGPLS